MDQEQEASLPGKNKYRATRRYNKKKAYKKAKRFYELFSGSNLKEEHIIEMAKKHADNLKVCSCHMCCGPRRLYGNGKNGKTLQEKKNLFNCE